MKFEAGSYIVDVNSQLLLKLVEYRTQRNFKTDEYLEIKSHILRKYLQKNNIKSVILPISGGVDSAVSLGILEYALKNTDIKIVPCNMSCYDSHEVVGVTNQQESYALSLKYCEQLKLELLSMDLSPLITQIKDFFRMSFIHSSGEQRLRDYYNKKNPWSEGQMIPYVRQALLYYLTSIYTDLDSKALIVGTTNLDEMSYIGFYGKASDGMVDLQPISDLHKSEVYQLAIHLGVPLEIRSKKPNGDMYHNKTDEEFFGFTYDFLELYTHYLSLDSFRKYNFRKKFYGDTLMRFTDGSKKIEELHKVNEHKYLVGSPAVHFDINNKVVLEELFYDKNKLVAFNNNSVFEEYLYKLNKSEIFNDNFETVSYQIADNKITKFESILNENIVNRFNSEINFHHSKLADITGVTTPSVYDVINKGIGSIRSSTLEKEFSKILYEKLRYLIPRYYVTKEDIPSDIKEGEVWEFVGVSEYFRYITYHKDWWLVPHYDSPYVYNDNYKTLQTVVVSLTDTDCDTEFIKPEIQNEKYNDYDSLFEEKDICQKINHEIGDISIFPHRLLHQVSKNKEGMKRVIRTDLIYKKIY